MPVSSTLPAGTGLSRSSHSTSSGNVRRMRAVEVSPAKSSAPSAPEIRIRISNGASQSSGTSTAGPSAQAPAKIFAWGR